MSDLQLFWRQMLRRPHQVVALAPSSTDLAQAMASGLGPLSGRVVELGAGTGKLTRAILARGVRPADLTLIERNADFARHLRRTFPGVQVCDAPAQQIADLVAGGAGAVISGLPLLSMPFAVQQAIVGGAFRMLRPGGIFVQFTYGLRPPVAKKLRRDLALTHTRSAIIWRNLPPARVYTFRRATDAPGPAQPSN
jgi:phosphatidylethanolamine/phosphatidyl-N-methylethanolamine N-methyltransferase